MSGSSALVCPLSNLRRQLLKNLHWRSIALPAMTVAKLVTKQPFFAGAAMSADCLSVVAADTINPRLDSQQKYRDTQNFHDDPPMLHDQLSRSDYGDTSLTPCEHCPEFKKHD